MEENKAISILSHMKNLITVRTYEEKALEMAIQALEEVQQYRAIEKRLADMFGDELSLENYVDMLEETLEDSIAEQDNPHIVKTRIVTMENVASLEAYRTIGTVEECRDAVERMKPKKPVHPPASLIWYCPNPHCPEDKQYLMSDKYKVCPDCGQKLEWG